MECDVDLQVDYFYQRLIARAILLYEQSSKEMREDILPICRLICDRDTDDDERVLAVNTLLDFVTDV